MGPKLIIENFASIVLSKEEACGGVLPVTVCSNVLYKALPRTVINNDGNTIVRGKVY